MRRITVFVLFAVAFCAALWGSPANASGTYYRPGAFAIGSYTGIGAGEYRIGARLDFQHFSRVRNFEGGSMEVGDVRLRTYSLTAERGLTDRSSVYVVLPFVDNDSATNADPFKKESGLGDIKLGYNQLLSGEAGSGRSWLGTLEVTIPGRNYSTKKLTAPGDNSVDFVGHVSYRNNSLFGGPLFYTVGAGFKLRASQSPDQLLWDGELGGRFGNTLSVSGFIDSINSMHGLGLGGPGFAGDFAQLKQTVTRLGGRVIFNVGALEGQLYYAKAIQFQNQAPFDNYGLSVTGHF